MQNGRGEGSLAILEKEKGRPIKDVLEDWSHEDIEWLIDDVELSELADIFLKTPFEYGFSGVTGKNFQALKDFCDWRGLDKGIYVPMLLEMSLYWVKGVNEKQKELDAMKEG